MTSRRFTMKRLIIAGLGLLLTAAPAQAGRGFWSELESPNPSCFGVALAVDPAVPTTLYAACSNGDVFRSEDRGHCVSPYSCRRSWTKLDLAPRPAWALTAASSDTIYLIGSQVFQVYRSNDRGDT